MKRFALIVLPALVLILLPQSASAQLVPCTGVELIGDEPIMTCQACNLVELMNNVLAWLVAILAVVAAISLVVSGFRMVASSGNVAEMQAAKRMITNVLIGFVIVLAAWLIIDFTMKALLRGPEGSIPGFGPWNEVGCVEQPTSRAITPSRGSAGLSASNPDFVPVGSGNTGVGSLGSCTTAASGPCSPAALSAAGFNSSIVNDAAQIVGSESGCNPNAESRTDTTTDGRTFSVGTWQINLAVHDLNCDGTSLDCPSAFRETGTLNSFGVKEYDVVNESLYSQCVALAKDPDCNNRKAAQLANRQGDIRDWACSALKCGIDTPANDECPDDVVSQF